MSGDLANDISNNKIALITGITGQVNILWIYEMFKEEINIITFE